MDMWLCHAYKSINCALHKLFFRQTCVKPICLMLLVYVPVKAAGLTTCNPVCYSTAAKAQPKPCPSIGG